MLLVACGGGDGGGDHGTTATVPAEGTAEGAAEGEHVSAADDHAGDGTGDVGHGDGATVSKEAFDELKLKLLELEVEVDQLQTLLGVSTSGEEPSSGEDEGGDGGDHADDAGAHGAAAWGYGDADRWGELADEFAACGEGTEQSPVDLAGSAGLDRPNITFDYQPADAIVVDTGHTVQIEVPDAGTITLDGTTYRFVQLHFHSPSEHTLEGDHWPMEWHLVHQADDGSLAVVAVLVEEGEAWPAFDLVIDSLPLESRPSDVVYGPVDVADFLPDLTAAYHYRGSLTTPPCTEGVAWSVLQASITMSAEQIDAFAGRIDEENRRPTQPLGDRVVELDLSA